MFVRFVQKFIMQLEIPELISKSTVKMGDRIVVEDKLTKFVDAGAGCLQVITDFDHTISKSRTSAGEFNNTTHRVFHAAANRIDPALKSKLDALTAKYYPIEMDPRLTNAEKLPHMEEWWKNSHELITQAKFNKGVLEEYVREAKVELRDGFLEFLQMAEQDKIPIVIFSAGIGNVIKIVLRQQYGKIPPNVHIISNMMQFDEAGDIVGFRPPLIHTFNKNRTVIQGEQKFFEQLKSRPNVLLMGDTLGDLNMDVGVVNEGSIVKIGFLNQLVDSSLPSYLAGYDIVLTDDQTFDVPLGILKRLIAHEKQ